FCAKPPPSLPPRTSAPYPRCPRTPAGCRTVSSYPIAACSATPHGDKQQLTGNVISLIFRFQWPLLGHTSLRLRVEDVKVAASEFQFQWPLLGHTSLRRDQAVGGQG